MDLIQSTLNKRQLIHTMVIAESTKEFFAYEERTLRPSCEIALIANLKQAISISFTPCQRLFHENFE